MTIQECLEEVDNLKVNQFDENMKIKWLDEVDRTIFEKLIKTHEENESVEFGGYSDDVDLSTELLVPEPYAELYVLYLMSKMDFYDGEIAQYNNLAAMYNNKYNDYVGWYHANHMPLQKNSIRRG